MCTIPISFTKHTVCILLPIHLSPIFSIVLAFLGPTHCRQHNVAEASVTMATTIALAGRCSDESGWILMSKWQETPCYKIEWQKEKHTQRSTRVSAPKHAGRLDSGPLQDSLLQHCLFLLLWAQALLTCGLLGSSFWSIWIYLDQHWLLCNCSVFDPTSIGSVLFC